MHRSVLPVLLAGVILMIAVSCSSGSNPISPVSTGPVSDREGAHQLWGLYRFTIDPEKQTLSYEPLRGAANITIIKPYFN